MTLVHTQELFCALGVFDFDAIPSILKNSTTDLDDLYHRFHLQKNDQTLRVFISTYGS